LKPVPTALLVAILKTTSFNSSIENSYDKHLQHLLILFKSSSIKADTRLVRLTKEIFCKSQLCFFLIFLPFYHILVLVHPNYGSFPSSISFRMLTFCIIVSLQQLNLIGSLHPLYFFFNVFSQLGFELNLSRCSNLIKSKNISLSTDC
jgi:hypothetical protein